VVVGDPWSPAAILLGLFNPMLATLVAKPFSDNDWFSNPGGVVNGA
jgi:hypothetical protein